MYFYYAFAELDDIAFSPQQVAGVVLAGIFLFFLPTSVRLRSQWLSPGVVQINVFRSNINEQLFTELSSCCMCMGATKGATRRARLSPNLDTSDTPLMPGFGPVMQESQEHAREPA